jgi:hypothetical protein
MSNFISSMAGPGLREMPPVSNVTPLPTRTTGGFCAACRNGQKRSHTESLHLGLVEYLGGQLAVTCRKFLRRAGEIARCADVCRQVAEFLGQRYAGSNSFAVLRSKPRFCGIAALGDGKTYCLEWAAFLLAAALHLGKAIQDVMYCLGRMASEVIRTAVNDGFQGKAGEH